MSRSLLRAMLLAVLAWAGIVAAVAADLPAAPKYRFNLPPSAELSYAIKSRQKGIPLEGEALVRWHTSAGKFSVANEARAMLLGKILDARSEGVIDDFGLAPLMFTEKRMRKPPTTTSFDRTTRTIGFSASPQPHPLKGGEQDKSSVLWQLTAVARAAPARFKPGSSWNFIVAGQRDATLWTFKVVQQEKLRTPMGDTNVLHVSRVLTSENEQQLDIWLAPSLEWYPVRLRYTEDDGDFIEQTLRDIHRPGS